MGWKWRGGRGGGSQMIVVGDGCRWGWVRCSGGAEIGGDRSWTIIFLLLVFRIFPYSGAAIHSIDIIALLFCVRRNRWIFPLFASAQKRLNGRIFIVLTNRNHSLRSKIRAEKCFFSGFNWIEWNRMPAISPIGYHSSKNNGTHLDKYNVFA